MIPKSVEENAERQILKLSDAVTQKLSESTETVGYADQCPDYMIVYEDAEVRPEMFTCEIAARARLKQAGDMWNCHLFQRIATA